ncbi:MAG: SpvB/TcaC N-terminal domain-containing protein [Bacteroidota bacterium]
MITLINKPARILVMTALCLLTFGTPSLSSKTTIPDLPTKAGESINGPHSELAVINEYMIKADATAIVVSNGYIEPNAGSQADTNGYFDSLAPSSLVVYDENGNPTGIRSSSAPPGGNIMGASAGSFSVNESGAATYSIPITVSPGTGGMEPQLALAYSSMGQNGLLGMGWTLSGLSSISRGRATLAQDGFIDGVDFDTQDRFILDGERLMVVNGNYGANGSEYRTEQNTFRKVVAYGQQGSGPEKFKVWTKDGLIYEYGYTEDSGLEPKGQSSALIWSVNKISDTKGNYIRFSYLKDKNITHQHIERIEYTGNDLAGLSPYNTVNFEYDSNSTITSYILGSPMENPFRMKRIVVQHQGADMRTYSLYYENKGVAGQSYLTAIQECGTDGKCFEATGFAYENTQQSNNFSLPSQWVNAYGADNSAGGWKSAEDPRRMADVNGDGLQDIVAFGPDTGGVFVSLSTGTGFTSPEKWVISGFDYNDEWRVKNYPLYLVDVNGDGMQDIVAFGPDTGGVVYVSLVNNRNSINHHLT